MEQSQLPRAPTTDPPPMDPVVDQALLDYVAERKDAVPDAWY